MELVQSFILCWRECGFCSSAVVVVAITAAKNLKIDFVAYYYY
jgi:hypothetical protein